MYDLRVDVLEISSKGSESFSAKGEERLDAFSAQSGDVEAESGQKSQGRQISTE